MALVLSVRLGDFFTIGDSVVTVVEHPETYVAVVEVNGAKFRVTTGSWVEIMPDAFVQMSDSGRLRVGWIRMRVSAPQYHISRSN